jgi:Clathrin-H-link
LVFLHCVLILLTTSLPRLQVISASLDEPAVVPFLTEQNVDPEVVLKLAARCKWPGAESLFVKRFNHLMGSSSYAEAAKVVATAPHGILRTPQTLDRFQCAPAQPNSQPPMLVYFNALLAVGSLNKFESLELCRPVLGQVSGLLGW